MEIDIKKDYVKIPIEFYYSNEKKQTIRFSESFWNGIREENGDNAYHKLGKEAYFKFCESVHSKTREWMDRHKEIFIITVTQIDFINEYFVKISQLWIKKAECISGCYIYIIILN